MNLGRLLIIVGGLLVLAGVLVTLAGKLPWLGRLPGDFVLRRGGVTVYLPLATSILLSVVLTLILSLLKR